MKRHIGSLGTALIFGTWLLGFGVTARAQQGPSDSQMPMEIPAQPPQQYPQQYPPPGAAPQGYPPQQGYPQPQGSSQQQGYPQQQGPNDPGAGRVSYVRGDLSTQHANSSEWDAASVNTPVVIGDHVSTGQNSRAEIQLDYADILRLSEQSSANIVNLSPAQIQLQVGQGLVNYDMMRGGQADVEIDTPNVAIRPQMNMEGSYRILVNPDGTTVVNVRKGSAEISTLQGSTQVAAGQSITIQGSGANAQYQIAAADPKDEWDRWNGERDRSIESAASWQNTNPYYTGTQDLDPYGQWNNVPDYGAVWFPAEAPGWAPYRAGRWVFEPYYGWTWVSYEPWGWAPYHYGRWFVYGGNWGWWPGPVYAGYRPVWAPAYVSFFGFGGGGVGFGFGFGGGFGSIGWLAIGPGDRFFPWYGAGIARVNAVNVYNLRNGAVGGFAPLRQGARAFSNVNSALVNERYRSAISSMPSNQFGRASVPAQQQRFDEASFHQASMMTGASPVPPARDSFRSSDRAVNATSIPRRSVANERFFGTSRAQTGFNRGVNPGGPVQATRPSYGNTQAQRGYSQPAQSGRPGYQPYGQSSRGSQHNTAVRSYEAQGDPQSRGNYSSQPAQSYSRGTSNNSGYSRPPLIMQQPVVAPRTYSEPPARSAPSYAPRGGSSPSGGYRGGSSIGHAAAGRGGRR